MSKATTRPHLLWPHIDEILSDNGPASDDLKVEEIYDLVSKKTDPPMPADFRSSLGYQDVISILEPARQHDPALFTAVNDLADAIRASLPQTGEKRTHAQVETDAPALGHRQEVHEMLGALNADSSSPSFDRVPGALHDYASGRGGHNVKRVKKDNELKAYVSLNTILASQVFDNLMDKVEDGLTQFIQAHTETLPLWDPLPDWAGHPEVLARVRSLKIPRKPLAEHSVPDVLLAALGTGEAMLDPEIGLRIYQLMMNSKTNWNLLNASGSGKTRLLFEILARHWAFYFACGHDAQQSPYGSRDILDALGIIASTDWPHYTTALAKFSNLDDFNVDDANDQKVKSTLEQRTANKDIAEHVFRVVALSRTLVFQSFLICWQRVRLNKSGSRSRVPGKYQQSARAKLLKKLCDGGILDETAAKRTWAFVQICPQLVLPTFPDVFCQVVELLQWAEPSHLRNAIMGILADFDAKARISVAAVMFDEVQALASWWNKAFGPELEDQPLTAAVMDAMAPGTKSLLAATKFNEFLVKQAILSGMAKSSGAPQRFITFGEQGTAEHVMGTLLRFFGPEFLENMKPELWNEIKFWLTARHRYLMTFIQYVLKCGPTSMHNVLNNMIWKLTGYKPAGVESIGDIQCNLLIPHHQLLKATIKEDPRIIHCIRLIVYAWVFHGEFPLLPKEDIELVTLGVGRLVPEAGTPSVAHGVVTSENMTAAALFNWLDQVERDESLTMMLNRDLSQNEPSVRGFALENSLVYLFWRKFANGCELGDVFNFVYLPPAWRNKKAYLVDVCRNHTGTGRPILVTKETTARLAWRTSTIAGTRAWFKCGGLSNLRVPFLRPDNMIGPDLFFILRLATGEEILICVQSKAWSSQHGADEILAEAFKLSPERFYGIKNPPKNAKVAKNVANRQAEMQVLLEDMLLPSSLDMSSPGTVFAAQPEYGYDEMPPKYPILRVFAAYEGSFKLPSTTPGRMGRYPLALLADDFLAEAQKLLPSMGVAAEAVGAERARVAAEQSQQRQQEEDEEVRYAAWAMEEDQLASELLKLVEESQDSNA